MEPTTSAKAHFDGRQIILDEPLELLPNTILIVTVLGTPSDERDAWNHFSAAALARAYGDAEPEYSAADIIKPE